MSKEFCSFVLVSCFVLRISDFFKAASDPKNKDAFGISMSLYLRLRVLRGAARRAEGFFLSKFHTSFIRDLPLAGLTGQCLAGLRHVKDIFLKPDARNLSTCDDVSYGG